jgi:hypothetical protein
MTLKSMREENSEIGSLVAVDLNSILGISGEHQIGDLPDVTRIERLFLIDLNVRYKHNV